MTDLQSGDLVTWQADHPFASPHDATVIRVAERLVLVEFADGSRSWTSLDEITPKYPDDCRKCARCIGRRMEGRTVAEQMSVGMIVCSLCGNKRCPHAAFRGYACSGSNDPRQAQPVLIEPVSTTPLTQFSDVPDHALASPALLARLESQPRRTCVICGVPHPTADQPPPTQEDT